MTIMKMVLVMMAIMVVIMRRLVNPATTTPMTMAISMRCCIWL